MKIIYILLLSVFMFSTQFLSAQITKPNISPDLKFTVYMDCYYLNSFNKIDDSLNIASFAGNSKFTDEFRLNVASMMIGYNTDNVRAAVEFQFGDNPHLMSNPDNEFIRYMSVAKFGFRISENMWLDAGFISAPIGCESGKPINNLVSSVSIGGYYQPASFLGLIYHYEFSDVFGIKAYYGNPYTLRFGKNENSHGGFQLNSKPVKDLNLSYSNLYGDNTEIYDPAREWLLYNNFVASYHLTDDIFLLGQFDVAHQSGVRGDNDRQEIMTSGFISCKYKIIDKFSAAARYEFFSDKSGMSTGYLIDGRMWSSEGAKWDGYGMNLWGASFGLEYNPVFDTYIKCEYRYNAADEGQLVFNRNTENTRHYLLFTTGIRF